MVYTTKSREDTIAEYQLIITEMENQFSIDDIKNDYNKIRRFQRNNEIDKIDKRMKINNKVYSQYKNTKNKLKKITSPKSVVTNINLTHAVNTTPATSIRTENDRNSTQVINNTCLRTTQTHDNEVIIPHQIDDIYSPLLRRQINFDQYLEINNNNNIESEGVNDAMVCLPCNEGEEDFGLVDTDSEGGDNEGEEEDSLNDFIVNNIEGFDSNYSDIEEDDPLDSDYLDSDIGEEEQRLTDGDESTIENIERQCENCKRTQSDELIQIHLKMLSNQSN